jgi:hypothetical protein
MKSLKEIPNNDGSIVLTPDVTQVFSGDYDPLEFGKLELDRTGNLIVGLLEANWHGIQKTIYDSAEGKASVSINITLKHLSPDSRSVKAKLGYSVKNTDEAECFVKNPNQPDMFNEDGRDTVS